MHWQAIVPLVFFLLVIFMIGIWANQKIRTSDSFLSEYFLGGREMGGFILAMTMIATYGSASSFI
ncbi:MAG TPA: sodium/panthothenate symporter, partial [Savagea sp.]